MQRKHYTVEVDMKPYLYPLQAWNQQIPLPNLVEVTDPKEALRLIRWYNANTNYYNAAIKLPDRQYSTYCKLFLASTPMGGTTSWNGSGIFMTHDYPDPRIFKFALCLHEKTEEGHSPNHNRGWHPGHCKHCGMDMTVDSGD